MGKTQKRNRAKVRKRKSSDDIKNFDDPIYCICRSTTSDTFMVACDACEEWFHGDCINITPKQAEFIENYYCQSCRGKAGFVLLISLDKDPGLQIVMKSDRISPERRYRNSRNSSFNQTQVLDDELKSNGTGNHLSKKRSRKILSPKPRYRNQPDTDTDIHDENFNGIPRFSSPSSSYSHGNEHITFPNGLVGPRTDRLSPVSSTEASMIDEGEISDHWPRVVNKSRPVRNSCHCSGCQKKFDCGSCAACRNSRSKGSRSQKCLLRLCTSNSRSSPTSKHRQKPVKISQNQNTLTDYDYESNFDEFSMPRGYMSGSHKLGVNNAMNVGSKMRRGDHLPGAHCSPRNLRYSDEPSISFSSSPPSRCYTSSGESSIRPPSKRNRNYLPPSLPLEVEENSSHVSSRQATPGAYAGSNGLQLSYESDEDVVLPELRQCIGPNCLNRTDKSAFCSSECQFRYENHGIKRPPPHSRGSNQNEQIVVPYNLPYPDHLYCKHHRMHSWHSPTLDNNPSFLVAPNNCPPMGIPTISPEFLDLYHGFPDNSCVPSTTSTPLAVTSSCLEYLSFYGDPSALPQHNPTASQGFPRSRPPTRYTLPHVVQSDFINNHLSVYVRNGSSAQHPINSGQSNVTDNLDAPDDHHIDHSDDHSAIDAASALAHSTRAPGYHRLDGGKLALNTSSAVISHADGLPYEIGFDSIDQIAAFPAFSGHDPGHSIRVSGIPSIRTSNFGTVCSAGTIGSLNGVHATTHDASELFVMDHTTNPVADGVLACPVLHNLSHASVVSAVPESSGPLFRHSNEFYMINDNDNIEINWPTSPGGGATISHGTV